MRYEEQVLRPAIQTAFDQGGLDAVEERHLAVVAKLEAPAVAEIGGVLRQAGQLHADETGVRCTGNGLRFDSKFSLVRG